MKTILPFLFTAVLLTNFQLPAQVLPVIIADGFNKTLIGIEVDSIGNVWVTEAGTGNNDGAITIIAPNGTKTPFMTGLPSELTPIGETGGPNRTIHLPGNKLLILVGDGEQAQAEALLIVDKTDFTPGTPLTLADVEQTIKIGDYLTAQGFMNSNPYNVAWDADGNMLIVDAGGNSIVKRDKISGELSIVVTLDPFPNPTPIGGPFVEPVPTDIIAKPDGSGYYVSQLTGFPFLEGAANIFNLDNSGNLTPWQTGFTLLTDLGYDPTDDNLCVMQLCVFGPIDTILGFIPGTGKVIKLLPDNSRDSIAGGMIGLNPSFAFDAAGNLYVSDLFGFVYKYNLVSDTKEQPVVAAAGAKAFPNPFSEQVTIEYELFQQMDISIAIYDLQGRLIRHFDEGRAGAGVHTLTWDGKSGSGLPAQAGWYVWRLQAGQHLLSGAILLAR